MLYWNEANGSLKEEDNVFFPEDFLGQEICRRFLSTGGFKANHPGPDRLP
jgi:hypothetical protein